MLPLKLILTLGSSFVLFLAIFYSLIVITEKTFHAKQKISREESENHKINNSNEFELLTKEGKLTKEGWSNKSHKIRQNYENLNPSSSYLSILNKLRFKKWNAIIFKSRDYIGLVAGFDLGYLSGILFHIADLKSSSKPFSIQEISLKPFSLVEINDQCKDNCSIIDYVKKSDSSPVEKISLRVSNNNLNFQFAFKNEKIKAEFDLNLTNSLDSIVTLNPISEDSTSFYFNEKTYSLKADNKSFISINDKNYPANEFYFGHDAGRGVWPIKSGWVWISASGTTTKGEDFGFNAGHGFINGSRKFTEDSFFINGKLFKIPYQMYKEDNKGDYIFEIAENQSSCSLQFKKIKENLNIVELELPFTDYLFKVLYGEFSGYCIDDKGMKYEIKEAFGLVETKNSIW